MHLLGGASLYSPEGFAKLLGVEFLGRAHLGLNGRCQMALRNTWSNFLLTLQCTALLVLHFLAKTRCYQT